MARLLPGENAKIDMINEYVRTAKANGEGLEELLVLFKPLILKLCNKWANYFDDANHDLIRWDNIVADAQYWLIEYTLNKYVIDGSATYNNFIKNHLDQRIRYIYETAIKYSTKHVFPDPDKKDPDDENTLERVVQRYATVNYEGVDVENTLISNEHTQMKKDVAIKILCVISDERYFTQREKAIFVKCIINGGTHDNVGTELGISRPRISQILGRIKRKLTEILDEEVMNWWKALE